MPTKVTNKEAVELFARIADMLQIKGENIHRVLSYRRASETIGELARDLNAIQQEGTLTDLPHIGKTLAQKIDELLTTGELEFYNRLADEIPEGVVDMLTVQGLGPKKVARFWQELDITSIDALKVAAENEQLRELSGMGAKSEAKILEGIEALSRRTGRVSIGETLPIAQSILSQLLTIEGALHGDIAGSMRRRRSTIGDIDLLIASHSPEPIMQAFVDMPEVARILGHGQTKSSVELHKGHQVDLRVLPPENYGTLLAYFTGSKDHNVRMRELALKQGLSLNEHHYSSLDDEDIVFLCETEEDVYRQLNMPYIPPELREDRGEIEAAIKSSLPNLITLEDMKGDLQLHTTWSDGKASIKEMAQAAMALGYEYILVTDHSYGLGVTSGLRPEDVPAQRAEIDQVNAELDGAFTVLHGVEVEIKADGSLDYEDDILAQFDLVQGSIHTSLRQPREQITARLLKAMSNPYIGIIGHPRGQLLPDREPADLDMDQIFEAALRHDIALEINANPRRLDLDDVHARRAIELGVKLTISTDAHDPEHFTFMHYGVATARRGWVAASQVINTWSLAQLKNWIEGRRK